MTTKKEIRAKIDELVDGININMDKLYELSIRITDGKVQFIHLMEVREGVYTWHRVKKTETGWTDWDRVVEYGKALGGGGSIGSMDNRWYIKADEKHIMADACKACAIDFADSYNAHLKKYIEKFTQEIIK